jgi:hypothetical protein
MKTLKLIVPLILLSAISAKANAFPDTLEKLFVEYPDSRQVNEVALT